MTEPADRHPFGKADLALLAVALIWGTTFTLVGAAMRGTAPNVFLSMRFGCAVLLMLPFLRSAGWGRAALLHGIWLGIVGYVGFWFQTEGLRFTSPSRSAFLTGLSVILVPAFSVILFRRRPPLAAVVGAVLASAGLSVLTRPELGGWNRGDVLTLGCAVAWAFYILGVHRATRLAGPEGLRPLVFAQLATTAILSLAALAISDARITPGPELWIALAVTAPFATTLTYFLQNWAQGRTTPTRTAVLLTMEPVFAAFFAWLWAGESFGWGSLLGGGLIVAGMLVVELRT